MVNLIGTVPPAEAVLRVAGAHLHVYGKSARPGRKLGHVTFVGPARDAVDASLRRLAEVVAEPALPR
jgi:5-(carboxyamino)imidazole ribonucleotide synthase